MTTAARHNRSHFRTVRAMSGRSSVSVFRGSRENSQIPPPRDPTPFPVLFLSFCNRGDRGAGCPTVVCPRRTHTRPHLLLFHTHLAPLSSLAWHGRSARQREPHRLEERHRESIVPSCHGKAVQKQNPHSQPRQAPCLARPGKVVLCKGLKILSERLRREPLRMSGNWSSSRSPAHDDREGENNGLP